MTFGAFSISVSENHAFCAHDYDKPMTFAMCMVHGLSLLIICSWRLHISRYAAVNLMLVSMVSSLMMLYWLVRLF